MARSGALLLVVALGLVAGCTADSAPTTTLLGTTTTTTATTTSTTVSPPLEACRRGFPRPGVDLQYETFFDAYKYSFNDQLIGFLGGDGPVEDPWLTPDHEGVFPDVASWVETGNELTDRFYNSGYGMGEPFQIFTTRRNEYLESQGISDLTLTLDIWSNQDCEWRVQAHSPVASPDPCLLEDAFPDSEIEVCSGPFRPIAGHLAVWTGEEVLVVGGYTGGLAPAAHLEVFAFDPASGSIRQLPAIPVDEGWSPLDLVWVDDRAYLVGKPLYRESLDDYRPNILEYDPVRDEWSEMTSVPGNDAVVGAVVWTGRELFIFGGELNGWSSEVKSYASSSDSWTLHETGTPRVEESAGVWTGTEAVFMGGYAHEQIERWVTAAYRDGVWETPADPGLPWIEFHELVWTGTEIAVLGGNAGPGHFDMIPLYSPATDSWRMSAPMPIAPRERFEPVWTGSEILVWGGYDTYGESHAQSDGAAYDPATDTWRVLAQSPLSPRCDHSATWTGSVLVIIGGSGGCGSPGQASDSDGAIYDPATDAWEYLGG